jgi:hypothetical protein
MKNASLSSKIARRRGYSVISGETSAGNKMLDLKKIRCASALYDHCGVVFEYEGKMFRALLPRGRMIFEILNEGGWIEDLAEKGLTRMWATDREIPGYERVIELERIKPVLPPFMWTPQMLARAGVAVCDLSEELLKKKLILWDLKGMTNMTFSPRGPLLMDIGAIYTVKELEENFLTTSVKSLFDQTIGAYYLPLWLEYGPFRKLRVVKRLRENHWGGEQGFAIVSSILRRLTLGYKVVPGLFQAKRYLACHRYEEFFKCVRRRIQRWVGDEVNSLNMELSDPMTSTRTNPEVHFFCDIIEKKMISEKGQVIFDLFLEGGVGRKISAHNQSQLYFISPDAYKGEEIYRRRNKKGQSILPIVCNIWDRSSWQRNFLEASADLVYILPDVFKAAVNARVPLDFMGRILSTLTKGSALVGISGNSKEASFPAFVSCPNSQEDPLYFVLGILSKYFQSHEVITGPPGSNAAVIILQK